MVYSYTITSICKNILPFSFKKRRLPAIAAAEQQLSKLQSDNLKWQQESFHQIMNLMGLSREGILPDAEVAIFRSHILDTLVASPFDYDYEQPVILRDKLIFLQELLYAKCITEEEYHSSKRPLLHRLAIQGDEIDARYVTFGPSRANSTDELCVINSKGKEISESKSKFKQNSVMKRIKGAKSVFSLVSSNKYGKLKEDEGILDVVKEDLSVKKKNEGDNLKKHYRTLFQKQGNEGIGECDLTCDERMFKSAKKKWKKSDSDDETTPLSISEKSDERMFKPAKKKCKKSDSDDETTPLSLSKKSDDVGIDKALGERMKKELSRTEIDSTSPNSHFSNDQVEAILTRLPLVDAGLTKFFPKSRCDINLGSGDMKKDLQDSEKNWTSFTDDDDENCHPNLFSTNQEKFNTTEYYDYNNSTYYNKVVDPFLYT